MNRFSKVTQSIFFLLALCLGLGRLNAQDVCLQEVRSIYKNFSSIGKNPDDKNTYYLNYTVRTATKDSSDGVAQADVKMWMCQKNLEIKSDQFEIYQDEKDVFMVLPQRKMLMLSDPNKNVNKEKDKRRKYLEFLQDTLFMVSKVAFCENIKDRTDMDKKIKLVLNESAQKFFGITSLTFFIQSAKQEIKKVRVDYYQGNEENAETVSSRGIVYIEYTFNEMTFDCKNKTLSNHLSSKFISKGNTLTSNYSGYKLIDNRKKGI